jgi:hypothetical protein
MTDKTLTAGEPLHFNTIVERQETGQWAILELMGRKVVAGYLTKDDWQGHAMLRIDVPQTTAFSAFTQVYGPQAVYCITYVSEQVAKLTAEHNRVNPVSVYVPDLQDMRRVQQENEELRMNLRQLREGLNRQSLPEPDDYDDDDDDDDLPDGHGLECTCETCIQNHPERDTAFGEKLGQDEIKW